MDWAADWTLEGATGWLSGRAGAPGEGAGGGDVAEDEDEFVDRGGVDAVGALMGVGRATMQVAPMPSWSAAGSRRCAPHVVAANAGTAIRPSMLTTAVLVAITRAMRTPRLPSGRMRTARLPCT